MLAQIYLQQTKRAELTEDGFLVYGANGIVGYLNNYNTEKEAVYIIKNTCGMGIYQANVTWKMLCNRVINTDKYQKEGYSRNIYYHAISAYNFE